MDAICVRQFIQTLGKKIYREPVPADSVNAYVAMFGVVELLARLYVERGQRGVSMGSGQNAPDEVSLRH